MRLLLMFISWALCSMGLYAQANGTNEERAVRDMVRRYVEARELRDPKAVAVLLAPNADQLVSSGEWRRGKDDLVRGMLASSERNSGKRTITVETVRFVAPGVAIADGRYEIAGTGGGQARRMWTTFIMTHSAGAWRIEAIRNMLPSSSR